MTENEDFSRKVPVNGNDPAALSTVSALIKMLPPAAQEVAVEDLKTMTPDEDMVSTLYLTVAAYRMTGLDGEMLYEVANNLVAVIAGRLR